MDMTGGQCVICQLTLKNWNETPCWFPYETISYSHNERIKSRLVAPTIEEAAKLRTDRQSSPRLSGNGMFSFKVLAY